MERHCRYSPDLLSPSGLNRFGKVRGLVRNADTTHTQSPARLNEYPPLIPITFPHWLPIHDAPTPPACRWRTRTSANSNWLPPLQTCYFGAAPWIEQGLWRSGVNEARALFSTSILWIASQRRGEKSLARYHNCDFEVCNLFGSFGPKRGRGGTV